jgi:hypothetical protein
LDFFVEGVFDGDFLRTETSRKVSPLIAPSFLGAKFVVNTEDPVPVFGDDILGLFDSSLICFLWHWWIEE